MKPRILVVDDEPLIADNLRLTLEREGYEVETAANTVSAMLKLEEQEFSLAVVDLVLPDGDGLHLLRLLKSKDPSLEVIIMTGHSSISKAVEATKQGAFYFVAKPFDAEEMLSLIGKALERRRLVAETSELRRKVVDQAGYARMLGSSPAMKRVFEMLESVAGSDANVLIVGESGTGKELAANAVHAQSPRFEGPLVKINCAALPKDLIESELFGHVKGAFTGASTDKPGLLEEAHRGSLLLDEITEMPLDLQAKLLRVLEDHTVRRLGGSKIVPVDFRLICSTNLDPAVAVREGQLRQDLYFRINTVTVTLPPLRERTADIPMLAKAFLERFRAKHGREIDAIDPEAYRRLLSYRWPGNVRELEHAVERAVLVARGREITVADLPESLQAAPAASDDAAAPAPGSLAEIERASIIRALEASGWNKQAAAALLGLRRPTLYSKMRRHGIPQRRS
jgi:DNA-binding NtrC family response regulator